MKNQVSSDVKNGVAGRSIPITTLPAFPTSVRAGRKVYLTTKSPFESTDVVYAGTVIVSGLVMPPHEMVTVVLAVSDPDASVRETALPETRTNVERPPDEFNAEHEGSATLLGSGAMLTEPTLP